MARKRHKLEEIVAKLRQVEVLTAQGQSIAKEVKTIAVTETLQVVEKRKVRHRPPRSAPSGLALTNGSEPP